MQSPTFDTHLVLQADSLSGKVINLMVDCLLGSWLPITSNQGWWHCKCCQHLQGVLLKMMRIGWSRKVMAKNFAQNYNQKEICATC